MDKMAIDLNVLRAFMKGGVSGDEDGYLVFSMHEQVL